MPHSLIAASFALPSHDTSTILYRRKSREVDFSSKVTRRPTLHDCQRFVGKPMTRSEAQHKLDTCPRFKQLAIESRGLSKFVGESGDLVARAIGLDYGNRLRACLAETKEKRIKHSTPY